MQANSSDIQALATVVMEVVQAVGRTQKRGLKRLGYDLTAAAVLERIARHGPIRPTDLAADLDLLPSSVTRHLHVLQRSGLVAVTADPSDGRGSVVAITLDGRDELARLQSISVQAFARLIDGWEAADIRTFTTLLQRFAAGLPGTQAPPTALL